MLFVLLLAAEGGGVADVDSWSSSVAAGSRFFDLRRDLAAEARRLPAAERRQRPERERLDLVLVLVDEFAAVEDLSKISSSESEDALGSGSRYWRSAAFSFFTAGFAFDCFLSPLSAYTHVIHKLHRTCAKHIGFGLVTAGSGRS